MNKLTKHLKEINETYFEHFLYASKISCYTLQISIIIFIHAVFPFVFETTAGDKLNKLNKELQLRKQKGLKMKEAATVVLVDKNKKILVLKRSKTSSFPGDYNFPGGSVNENEEYKTAAVRELKEEANLDSPEKSLQFLGTLKNKFIILYTYITDEFSGDLQLNEESDEYKWVTFEELCELRFVGNKYLHEDISRDIKKYLSEK